MKKALVWRRRIAVLIMTSIVFFHLAVILEAGHAEASTNVPGLNLEVSSAILIDAATGQVLYEYNADVALPPASMSKMMTEYLVLEHISNGRMTWDDPVTTSQQAAAAIGSGQMLAVNETLTVRSMFEAMSIYSANDASVALAEKVSGSEEAFAELMNQTARRLGLSSDAHFINSTGLPRVTMGIYAPTRIQGETLMSARDAATLAYHILNEYEEVLEFTSIPEKKLRESDRDPMINWNWMLEGNAGKDNFRPYVYEGLDGLKTGFTNEAGYCFTGTAERNGLRLISVVMGAKEPQGNRFIETRKLLDYGFNTFELKEIIKANQQMDVLNTVEIKKAVTADVSVETESNLSFLVRRDMQESDIVITAQTIDESLLVAPIEKGAVLGKLMVSYDDLEHEVNLIASEDVPKAGWFKLLLRSIRNFFVNLF